MNQELTNLTIYRVLIIEDEPDWFEKMEYFLRSIAKRNGIQIEIVLVDNAAEARKKLGVELFHAVAIDLRLPEQVGGVLTSQAFGVELMHHQIGAMPLVWGHIFTAYAKEHALEILRESIDSEKPCLPIWEKSLSDNAGVDRYTPKEWAQRLLTVLLPGEEAKAITSQNAWQFLTKSSAKPVSPLGEAVDFAFRAGCRHLPPGLAQGCGTIRLWLDDNLSQRLELQAFNELLFFAENLQHWLWVQAAALLSAFGLMHKLIWPADGKGKGTRFDMEQALTQMLQTLQNCGSESLLNPWLSHLHSRGCGESPLIIEALRQIRLLRNEAFHQRNGEALDWDRLVLPIRVIMDASAYLAAYPVLTSPVAAPDGRWRFKVLQGEAPAFPEMEWALADGVIGGSGRFAPKENGILYQLWPAEKGGYRLLKLSPFVQRRSGPTLEAGLWLLLAADAVDSGKLWERNALDGSVKCNRGAPPERLAAISSLRTNSTSRK